MVAESSRAQQPLQRRSLIPERLRAGAQVLRPIRKWLGAVGRASTSSLTRRIVLLNLAALIALVAGILYLNQFRAGLIDTRVESLLVQGQIIAAAIAAQATVETDAITVDLDKLLELQAGQSGAPYRVSESATEFPINPERVAPLLRRLISPTRTRARIYDTDGTLLLDSRGLYMRGLVQSFDLPPLGEKKNVFERWWDAVKLSYRRGDLPVYEEIGSANGREYTEVASALNGQTASVVRVGEDGGLIVSVAVPVQRYRAILGSLLLSTESGDIDAIVQAERMAIVRVFLVAAAITVLLSILLASTIAGPVRRLAAAAERVRRGVRHRRAEIPDLGRRKDEIGHLSRVLADMTAALYKRMEAIESFAADVAHELKNPLTSLRSAVETLPIAKTEEQRNRLFAVIKHDVKRLDRLISDISDASRLDAELARESVDPVDMARLLETVIAITRETRVADKRQVQLTFDRNRFGKDAFFVLGRDSRLGQVFNNLIDNALSFSPPGGLVRIHGRREASRIVVTVDDDGPGIRAENVESIFERFYTDRPEGDDFGQNSGLGLAISRQIVEAHRGTIRAENRTAPDGRVEGARFTVVLPTPG
ncbi:MAG: stimulus-sensing domain-containing protein [Propylenella sp.]